MTSIQPRFEFRVWSEELADVASRFRALNTLQGIRHSSEIYVVTAGVGDVNPKVRDEVLDVKVLLDSQHGCERWRPWLKHPFPVAALVLAEELFPRLGLEAPELAREVYTTRQLVEEVMGPHPALAAVEVSKRREAYAVDGCIGEVADVVIAGRAMQSAALESVDLDALLAACELTGLADRANVNYQKAIKHALGWDA